MLAMLYNYWLGGLLVLLSCISLVVWQSKYRKCNYCDNLIHRRRGLQFDWGWICVGCARYGSDRDDR